MAMLAIGAAWGRLVGQLVTAVLPGLGITASVSMPAYAVVGAAAALGTRTSTASGAVASCAKPLARPPGLISEVSDGGWTQNTSVDGRWGHTHDGQHHSAGDGDHGEPPGERRLLEMVSSVRMMTASNTRFTTLPRPATHDACLQIIVPLMLTVFFAKLVGDALSYSIYDTHIRIRGAPVLVRHPDPCCAVGNCLHTAGPVLRDAFGQQCRWQMPDASARQPWACPASV